MSRVLFGYQHGWTLLPGGRIDAFLDPRYIYLEISIRTFDRLVKILHADLLFWPPAVQIALLVAHAHLSGGKKIPTLQTFISNEVTIFNH